MKTVTTAIILALLLAAATATPARSEEAPEGMQMRSAFDPSRELFVKKSPAGEEVLSTGAPIGGAAGGGEALLQRTGRDMAMPAPWVEEGREFRLKVRELADRLLEANEGAVSGRTILAASFVSVDQFDKSSSFGKLVSEMLISEFNRRGMRVREYRTRTGPEPVPGSGEFMLTREPAARPVLGANDLVLAGTYYSDEANVFVNARLFDADGGMVLSASSMVLPQSETTRTMLARGSGMRMMPAETGIRAFSDMADESSIGFLFNEEDLH
jgi:TolB-like protein